MLKWALEHPWMTFFIILSAIETVGYIVKYITGYKSTETDSEGDEE